MKMMIDRLRRFIPIRGFLICLMIALGLRAWPLQLHENLLMVEFLKQPDLDQWNARLSDAPAPIVRWVAEQKLEQGDAEVAFDLFASLEGGEQAPWVYFTICVTHWEAGRTSDALDACNRGAVPAEYWYERAAGYDTEGDLERAGDAYAFALALRPGWIEAQLRLASIFDRQSRYADLLAMLSPILSEPEPPLLAFQMVGYANWRLGRTDEALAAVNAGRVQFPEDPLLALYMGYIAQDLGEFNTAAEAYDLYLSDSGGNSHILMRRAAVAEALADWRLAMEIYEEVVRNREPGNLEAWLGFGRTSQMLGLLSQARAAYEAVLSIDPENSNALAALESIK